MNRRLLFLAAASLSGALQAAAQDINPATGAVNNPPSAVVSPVATPVDSSLTTYEAAVECATSIMVELHKNFVHPKDAVFKAGLCAGKVQTYMLTAQSANPGCFPKISLEEGIGIFVKWSEAHRGEGDKPYPEGLKAAFTDAVPCLKK
jgi:hypothetical protein